jgi:hypothetical protein
MSSKPRTHVSREDIRQLQQPGVVTDRNPSNLVPGSLYPVRTIPNQYLSQPTGSRQLSRTNQDAPVPSVSLMPMAAAASAMVTTETSSGSNELWSFSGAIFYFVFFGLFFNIVVFGVDTLNQLSNVSDNDWADTRCKPWVLPIAGWLGPKGTNASDNFNFCMGGIFKTHSMPFVGTIMSSFTQFTGMLSSLFDSLGSIQAVIATLGGGINTVFQEFTERISFFFFKLRMSGIYLKTLFGRLYAILFSVMYMGMSGITGMTSFTNTFLFSFLNTFCFPGETEVMVKNPITGAPIRTPIKDVKIGDVLLPGHTTVTALFRFYSKGQPMVKLGPVTVSTNHYLMHNGKPIMAGDHPHAIQLGPWNSDDLLYCLNTTDHTIPMEYLTFLDYDEAPECDEPTLRWIEKTINAKESTGTNYAYQDACFAINEEAKIKTMHGLVPANQIQIGDRLTTGSEVVGIIRRQVSEVCMISDKVSLTPATLYWDQDVNQWKRIGEHRAYRTHHAEFISFVVIPNSQIELEDGTRVRDYMEVCSPDSEMYYAEHLESIT